MRSIGSGDTVDDLAAADDRTLRMAAPELTAERLERFIIFERAWLEQAKRVSGALMDTPSVWEATLSAAHDEALKQSGLSAAEFSQLDALCRDFCGRRRISGELERHLAETKDRLDRAKAQGSTPSQKDVETAQRLSEEIARRKDAAALERRYGEQAVRLLTERAEELAHLHEELLRTLQKQK
jgi:hypothetical protein